jgi:hypothetical protein
MEFFSDPDIIKLSAFGIAFVVGVGVCIYVALRETAELNRRRRAKKLMYNDAVRRELDRKKNIMQKIQNQEAGVAAPDGIDTQSPMQRSNTQSFA